MTFGKFEQFGQTITALSPFNLRDGLRLGSSASTPDHLLVRPVDPWPGDIGVGAAVMRGGFSLGGDCFVLDGSSWVSPGLSQKWLNYLHGFKWLRDLRVHGGEGARFAGAAYIKNWIDLNRDKKSEGWRADRTGMRLSMWISHYDFFAAHDEEFQDMFFPSVVQQARYLMRHVNNVEGLGRLYAAKGLLYAGLALEGYEALVERALEVFSEECNKQILSDGGDVTRSPETLLYALKIYLDVRSALAAGAYPLPEKILHAIDRMGPALRFFVYSDKHLGVFNGGRKNNADLIESVLAQAGVRGKMLSSLPSMGYERVTQGRTLLMVDTGKIPPWPHDRNVHTAPLSFEMAYGKERIFVSCGAHPASEEWNETLRATAAHNGLCINHRNACEIRPNGHLGRKVQQAYVKRTESRKACLLEMSHDGYLSLNGITHARRLFLCEQGTDFRGEDTLECMASPERAMDVAIRFHLHPRVMVSLVQNGEEALIRIPTGAGWRFQHTGGRLALENSIYIGTGSQPRRTKQLVIYGQVLDKRVQFKWALQREGL
ncbi:MAG: heparinase [Micavibrio sp.]|nr:heparinase [Micavibrio sp.]|tara:strand:- start:731 stop:2365 length:1635 start_codon:yes stop_codon:yes gene_type:complete